jgi:hypothetical protein
MSTVHQSTNRHKIERGLTHQQRAPKSNGAIETAEVKRELLPFNSKGILKRGIHSITWEEFTRQFGYNEQRQKLLRGLLRGIRILQRVGCHAIYIGGSFITRKHNPSDVDVIWESSDMSFERVRRVAPIFFEMTPGSPEQKARFSSEFYPSEGKEDISGLSFLEFFQCDWQERRRRGIVRIDITYIPSSRPKKIG